MENNFKLNAENLRRLSETLRRSNYYGENIGITLYVKEDHDGFLRQIENKLEVNHYHPQTAMHQDLDKLACTKRPEKKAKILLRRDPVTQNWYLVLFINPLSNNSCIIFISALPMVISHNEIRMLQAMVLVMRKSRGNSLVVKSRVFAFNPKEKMGASQEHSIFFFLTAILSRKWELDPVVLKSLVQHPNKSELFENRRLALWLLRQESIILSGKRGEKKSLSTNTSSNKVPDKPSIPTNTIQITAFNGNEQVPLKLCGQSLFSRSQVYLNLQAKLNLQHQDIRRLCPKELLKESAENKEKYLMIHLVEVYSKFQRIINRLSMTSLEKITELENVVDSRDKIIQKAVIDLESEKIKASRLKSENDHFVRFKVKKRASKGRTTVNSWDQARALFSGLATVNTDTRPRMTRAPSTSRVGSQNKSKF